MTEAGPGAPIMLRRKPRSKAPLLYVTVAAHYVERSLAVRIALRVASQP